MIIELNGSKIEISDKSFMHDPFEVNDLYVVKAPSGMLLFTCQRIGCTTNNKPSLIFSTEDKTLAYDLYMCYRVIDVK